MGFRINTNIAALSAHTSATMNNRSLDNSLSKLSSGLRINKAADDASGLAIANSLRAQASSLGQAISNGNDAIGLIQTADGALSEYSNILDTIKTKAVQAASDGQNTASRLAIQKDIDALMKELNIIAKTTSFNGQKLLSGTFQNKEFQMGANANESVKVSIASAETSQIGQTSRADLSLASEMGGEVSLTMKSAATGKSLTLKTIDVKYDNNVQNSMGALADEINRYSGDTGISAKAVVKSTATNAVAAGTTGSDFSINGINIGAINVAANDNDGTLVNAINSKSSQTGVTASMSTDGKLTLQSDGRSIKVEGDVSSVMGSTASSMSTIGKLELVQAGSAQFQIEGIGAGATGADITITEAVTTSKDSILASGSTLAAGSKILAGSTVGGDAKVLAEISASQLDTQIKSGSTIAFNSIIKAGTEIGGQMIVGGDTNAASVSLTEDMLLSKGSTLKAGSILGKGTVLSTTFTSGGVTYNKGDTLTSAVTLGAGVDLTLTDDMVLKYSSTTGDNSAVNQGSSLNTGTVAGADFTVGTTYDSSVANVSLPNGAALGTDSIVTGAALTMGAGAGNGVDFKAGDLLADGTTFTIATAGSYAGPTLITTSGVISEGDAITAANQVITLKGDQIVTENFSTVDNTAVSIAVGSILSSTTQFDGATAGATLEAVTGKTGITVANDMTLKAGSTLQAGSTLLAGSTLGDSTYVYGTETAQALKTYDTSSIKAGSVLENGSIYAEGSTIGGKSVLSADVKLSADMTLKAGTILNNDGGAGATTMLKAGTLINQDMTLHTNSAGTGGSDVELKAGDVLSTDLYVKDGTTITLSKDMMMKKDSVLAQGSTLSVNTENAGTVGLSNEEFTNLSDIDVTTLEGAMKAIDTLSAAITNLDTIRSNLGSVQNQVVSTINNISVTQVNVKSAESNIRDVDFAAESANFSKFNILAQSGSYAMSQANAVQQNVLRLLQ